MGIAKMEITTFPEDYEVTRLREQFKIVCRKCGSENIAINIEESHDYGGDTGGQSGRFQIGCNGCKTNDWLSFI